MTEQPNAENGRIDTARYRRYNLRNKEALEDLKNCPTLGKRKVMKTVKRNLKLVHVLHVLMMVWILPLSLNGCGESIVKVYEPIDYSDGDEYTAFTAEGAVPSFSFEYPSDYKLYSYQLIPEFQSTSILLSNVYSIESATEAEWNYKHAQIYITKINEYFPEAATYVDERIGEYKWLVNASFYTDFKLLKKNRVTVAGMEGWEIVMSYIDLPNVSQDLDVGIRTMAVPVVTRELLFDYQDTVWLISVDSDADNADQAKLDYEHILGTLRILE